MNKRYILKRALNYYIDAVFVLIIAFAILYLEYVTGLKQRLGIDNGLMEYIAGAILYYFFMELFFDRTIAKFITRTKVQYNNTDRPKALTILIRTFSRLIPLEPISIFLREDYRMWHDSLSETRVIDLNKNESRPGIK